MKKALIICHDFPPLKSVGAQRPFSWFKYLPENSIYPVIITRKWVDDISVHEEKFTRSDGPNNRIETSINTLIQCEPSTTLRNSIIEKHGLEKKKVLRKILTVRDHIMAMFGFKYDETSYLYAEARKYIQSNKVDVIIATGEPFILFKYAHLLSSEFNIPWIADYRDEWTNNFSLSSMNWSMKMLKMILASKEKVWTSNCSFFTTTSPPWIISIENQINKKGYLLRNGIDSSLLPNKTEYSKDIFELIFAGTLYDFEYLESLMIGLEIFLKSEKPQPGSFKLKMVGIELNITSGTTKFLRFAKQYQDWIEIIPPTSIEKVIKLESEATACLNLVAGNISQGIYSVKLYEYLMLRKPVINLESTVSKVKHEFYYYTRDCQSSEGFAIELSNIFRDWKEGQIVSNEISSDLLKTFDRKFQCKVLADLIDNQITSTPIGTN